MAVSRNRPKDGATLFASNREEVSKLRQNNQHRLAVPDGTTCVEENAFSETGMYFYTLQLPESLRKIRSGAFKGFYNITSLVIPEGVTSIGEEAFADCYQLRSVTLPKSLTEIGRNAFANTAWWKHLGGLFKEFEIIGEGLLLRYTGKKTHVVIPKKVRFIAGSAFAGLEHVTSVEVPAHVVSIGSGAFAGCTGLTEIRLPEDVLLGEVIFEQCTALQSFRIPAHTTKLREGMFRGCTALQKVQFPVSFRQIDAEVFQGCTSLTACQLPERVNSIGTAAFRQCTALQSFRIPERITILPEQVFSDCTALEQVQFPDELQRIEREAFAGCTSLTSAILPDRVSEIGESAFRSCSALEQVQFPEKLRCIAQEAFRDCTSLQNIAIYSSLEALQEHAFEGCSSLKEVRLPEGLQFIGDYAFYQCTSLKSLLIPETVRQFGANAFTETPWYAHYTEPFMILGDGVLFAYRGDAAHVRFPETVRSTMENIFPAEHIPKEITLPDSIEEICWHYIPGLHLHLTRKGRHICLRMDALHEQPGRDEKRVFAFWGSKNMHHRHRIFFEIKDPVYKFPLSILMHLTEPEDELFAYYIHRNLKDLLRYMIQENDVENLTAFAECGHVTAENIDELLQYAIAVSQKQGTLDAQMFLMDYKSTQIGYQSIEEIFNTAFDL